MAYKILEPFEVFTEEAGVVMEAFPYCLHFEKGEGLCKIVNEKDGGIERYNGTTVQ